MIMEFEKIMQEKDFEPFKIILTAGRLREALFFLELLKDIRDGGGDDYFIKMLNDIISNINFHLEQCGYKTTIME